jgi:hypothetical protein
MWGSIGLTATFDSVPENDGGDHDYESVNDKARESRFVVCLAPGAASKVITRSNNEDGEHNAKLESC